MMTSFCAWDPKIDAYKSADPYVQNSGKMALLSRSCERPRHFDEQKAAYRSFGVHQDVKVPLAAGNGPVLFLTPTVGNSAGVWVELALLWLEVCFADCVDDISSQCNSATPKIRSTAKNVYDSDSTINLRSAFCMLMSPSVVLEGVLDEIGMLAVSRPRLLANRGGADLGDLQGGGWQVARALFDCALFDVIDQLAHVGRPVLADVRECETEVDADEATKVAIVERFDFQTLSDFEYKDKLEFMNRIISMLSLRARPEADSAQTRFDVAFETLMDDPAHFCHELEIFDSLRRNDNAKWSWLELYNE
ncbi:hypothetical protein HDU88_005393 [Geranomyces variabilis]|nr:hypothetical protein HDU88_005393 [Geranomyces variabilis]